jgi:hypothetical protein
VQTGPDTHIKLKKKKNLITNAGSWTASESKQVFFFCG